MRSNNNYGSISGEKTDLNSTASSSSRKVIYCVHGKPSAGCCKVLEQEVINLPLEIDISANCKENPDASELGKEVNNCLFIM